MLRLLGKDSIIIYVFSFLCRYTPIQLPRADIKPYHESYFTDNPSQSLAQTHPPSSLHSSQAGSNGEVLPVEGLAASLHARILNNHNTKNESMLSTSRRYRNFFEIIFFSFLH